MATNNIVTPMTKEEKLNNHNCKIWHKRMLDILDQYELLYTINAPMAQPEERTQLLIAMSRRLIRHSLKRITTRAICC